MPVYAIVQGKIEDRASLEQYMAKVYHVPRGERLYRERI